jgi:hypothetical protein
MSSTLFKAAFAGAIAAGALFLPAGAAQAATRHHPCNGPGFGDAFFGDGLDFFDDGFGFPLRDYWHRDPGTIIVVVSSTHHHHDKPAPADNGAGGGSADGYHRGGGAA